jgi:hypothetical protein
LIRLDNAEVARNRARNAEAKPSRTCLTTATQLESFGIALCIGFCFGLMAYYIISYEYTIPWTNSDIDTDEEMTYSYSLADMLEVVLFL